MNLEKAAEVVAGDAALQVDWKLVETRLLPTCPQRLPRRMWHDRTCTLVWVLWQLVKGWAGRTGAQSQGNPPAWLQGTVGVKFIHFLPIQHQQRFFISSNPEEMSHVKYDSLLYMESYWNGLRRDGLNLQALAESLGTTLESLLDQLLFMACTWFKEQRLEGEGGGRK